jgi:hypothetical protein
MEGWLKTVVQGRGYVCNPFTAAHLPTASETIQPLLTIIHQKNKDNEKAENNLSPDRRQEWLYGRCDTSNHYGL